MYKELKGPRVTLRKTTPKDSQSISDNANDREVALMVPMPFPYTIKDANDYQKISDRYWKNKIEAQYGIEFEGNIVGRIGVMDIDRKKRSGELGYWLGKNHWGKGVMSEAISLILSYSFGDLKLRRIHAGVYEPNLRSAKLLEKVGFVKEGVVREHGKFLGKWENLHLYGLLKKDWKNF